MIENFGGDPTDTVKIGKFIAQLRRERGLTQTQLGEIVGATNKTVSRWETGTYMPPIDVMDIISKEFGVSLNELVAGERIGPEAFRQTAEVNLKSALEESAFTLKERVDYFSKRWERSKLPLKIFLGALYLAGMIWGICIKSAAVVFAATALAFLAGIILYNVKRAYVERKAFGSPGMPVKDGPEGQG